MAGRNSRNRRKAPGNARTMGVKDKPTSSRRRPPANAKKMTVDKAKSLEASKSGRGKVSAKDKKTLRNASIRESKPVTPKNKANASKKTTAKVTAKKASSVSTKVQVKKVPAVNKGRSVTKTSPRRVPKDMGNAKMAPKKAVGVAKSTAKSTPFVAVAAGTVSASMERSSHLISTGKLSNPMDMFGDKALYGDRLNKVKTTQMPLPKSKPGLSKKANEKYEKATKPTVTAPQKAVTKTSTKVNTKPAVSKKKSVKDTYKAQNSKATQTTRKRMDSGYKNPAKAPKGSPKQTPKKSSFSKNTQKSLDFLMSGDW